MTLFLQTDYIVKALKFTINGARTLSNRTLFASTYKNPRTQHHTQLSPHTIDFGLHPPSSTFQTTLTFKEMPQIIDLPDELLLNISHRLVAADTEPLHGGYLVGPNETLCHDLEKGRLPHADLVSLCATARKLRAPAAEVLYTYPKLAASTNPVHGEITINNRTPLVSLLRTLVLRPELARRVKGIRLLVLPRDAHHAPATTSAAVTCRRQSCYCKNTDFLSSLRQVVERVEIGLWARTRGNYCLRDRAARYRFYRKWIRLLQLGNEPALAGLILHLVPNLEHLSLRSYAGTAPESDDEDDSEEESQVYWGRFNPDFCFGTGLVAHPYPTWVSGFSKLASVTSSTVLPWSVISLPTLKKLEYEINDDKDGGLFNWSARHLPSDRPPHPVLSTLILNIDVSNLAVEDVVDYIPRLLENLPSLKKLHIRVFSDRKDAFQEDRDGEVDLAIILPQVSSAKELVIDTTDLSPSSTFWLTHLSSYNSFPALKRLVVPQRVLFEVHNDNTSLPSTVESLEIIDSTRQMNGWAQAFLNSQGRYAGLRRISFWCDRNSKALVRDGDLRDVPAWYDCDSEQDPRIKEQQQGLAGPMDEDWKPFDWVADQIWDELKDAGIEFVVEEETRGWRKTE
jgi:hypothetical protein